MRNKIATLAAALVLAISAAVAAPAMTSGTEQSQQQVAKQVRHELLTLPYYGVFDNLSYKVEGNTVTLYGQVVQPSTRSDAEHRVARINGVQRVVNNIEVLPLSGFDNELRVRAFRAISRSAGLYRYMMGANPSIHIVVNGGHVTLEGVVSNKGDSQLAFFAVNGVPGVFSVTNNLQVENRKAY